MADELEKRHYVCPSVMEMLDALRVDRRKIALIRYTQQEEDPRRSLHAIGLPDFLADFVVWDHENGYGSFAT